jgi:hypothetical protein
MGTGERGKLIFLGLTRRNTELLLLDRPIRIDLEEFGVRGQLILMGGETEDSIREQLRSVLPPDTIVVDKRGEDQG